MSKTKRLTFCAVMLSLALALSYAERFLPLQLLIPLPGIKLGLANVVTLVVLYYADAKTAFAVLIPRCVLGALFGGSITALLFSLGGGTLALAAMSLAKRSSALSVYGVSILGAAAHNVGQIAAAILLMHSVYVAAYLPFLLVAALFTGFLTATVCNGVLRVLPPMYIKEELS